MCPWTRMFATQSQHPTSEMIEPVQERTNNRYETVNHGVP